MKLSDLKHRIVIEQMTGPVSDGIGGTTATWSTFKTVWARIESVLGNERKFAGRLEENVTHVITCRSKSVTGATSEMRVTHEGRTFQIKSVVRPNEIDEWTSIRAVEGVGS